MADVLPINARYANHAVLAEACERANIPVPPIDANYQIRAALATLRSDLDISTPVPPLSSRYALQSFMDEVNDVLDVADEIATITVVATSGNYTLTFSGDTTANIAVGATAAAVQAALEGLDGIDPRDVTVTSPSAGVYKVEFGGEYVGEDAPAITANDVSLTLNERQAIHMGADVTSGTFTITGTAGESSAVDFDATDAEVRAALGEAITGGTAVIQTVASLPDYEWDYIGALADTNVAQPTLNTGNLVGGTATIETLRVGGSPTVTIS